MKTPKYITTDNGPDGKERFYLRRPGQKKIRIHGVPWTPSFMEEYEAALTGKVLKRGVAPQQAGTFSWLCDQYFSSSEFIALDDQETKPRRRRMLLRICRESIAPNSQKKFGDVPLSTWSKKAIRAIRDRFSASSPSTANDYLTALRAIFKYAVEADHCEGNPTRDVKYLHVGGTGHHTWTIEEVVIFENFHPIGTKERLAMGLHLFTGQRISDASRLGPQHVKLVPTEIDGVTVLKKWLVFTQHKNRKRKAIHMEIPMRPELEALIAASPIGNETFLTNAYDRPWRTKHVGDWFSAACIAAGVPGRSHGLRKAAASRLAELGATEKEIMAITGHTTSKEVKRYTEAADKRILAAKATALSVPKKKVG